MAASIANRHTIFRGGRTVMYAEITMDSSYASGGEAINAADFGFVHILGVFCGGSPAGYITEITRSTDTQFLVKVYANSTSTNTVLGQIVTGKDLSAVTIPVLIVGR